MLEEERHVYYWAWAAEDNKGHSYFSPENPRWYRVFRDNGTTKSVPVTEPMSREEAVAYCHRIIKLTGGREIL